MSTTARKARKRENYAFLASAKTKVKKRALKKLIESTFALKDGTPFEARLANQPRPIHGRGEKAPSTRFGITSRIAQGYKARGLEVPE